jgi:hypothetical protein
MAHNGKNYLRYSTLSRNSGLNMERISSDTQQYQEPLAQQILNLIKELIVHNDKYYLRYATSSSNSWVKMERIISDPQPYQGIQGSIM